MFIRKGTNLVVNDKRKGTFKAIATRLLYASIARAAQLDR